MFVQLRASEKFEAASMNHLRELGVRLEMGHDFEEYRELVAEARPDHPIGDPFNPDKEPVGKGNALWIAGRDSAGDLMHLQALRTLPVQQGPVAEYFRRNFRRFSPSELDIDFERSRYRAGPGAKRMTGTVVYSGETWIGGKPGTYRGTGLSTTLGKYAMLTAQREFGADYVVGFMARPVAYKGFCLRMGFMHAEPLALRWYVKGNDTPLEGVMVYMSADDIDFVLDLPNDEIEAQAA